MNASKFFNPLTISAAGIVATLLAGGLIFFLLIKNTLTNLNAQTATYNANVQYEGTAPLEQAEAKEKQAVVQVQMVTDQWNQIQQSRNPVIDYSNVMLAWNQYINELNFKLGPSIEQWMPSTGIKPTAAITTPAAPADPNAVLSKNPIVIPLNAGAAINVVGSFPQILRHVAAWNNFNRIVLIDKLNLSGISPWVTGSYTATVYEFPLNGNTPGPTVPTTAGAGAAGGPGGRGGLGPPPGSQSPGGPPPR